MMRWLATTVLPASAIATAPAAAQSYGITPMPGPARHAPLPRTESAYDRAERGWQQERHDCLSGGKHSKSAARSCAYIQRTDEPLPSDYLKIPSGR